MPSSYLKTGPAVCEISLRCQDFVIIWIPVLTVLRILKLGLTYSDRGENIGTSRGVS